MGPGDGPTMGRGDCSASAGARFCMLCVDSWSDGDSVLFVCAPPTEDFGIM